METVYYEDPEVCVTNRRMIVHGKSVPLQSVRGVEQIIDVSAKVGWPVAALCVGTIATLSSMEKDAPGMAFLFLVATLFSAVWMAATGTWYFIALVKGGRTELVVATKNESFARDVVRAVHRALSGRGETIPSPAEDGGPR